METGNFRFSDHRFNRRVRTPYHHSQWSMALGWWTTVPEFKSTGGFCYKILQFITAIKLCIVCFLDIYILYFFLFSHIFHYRTFFFRFEKLYLGLMSHLKLHFNIIIEHVGMTCNLNKLHVNKIMLHAGITIVACARQTYTRYVTS